MYTSQDYLTDKCNEKIYQHTECFICNCINRFGHRPSNVGHFFFFKFI